MDLIPKNHYCYKVRYVLDDHLNTFYHDTVYGFPVMDDNQLFERLILEINQAGLNWTLILRKQKNFQEAFDEFEVEKVALYNEKDRERLLQNTGIIRNKLKINATIFNAQKILELQNEFGSFSCWLDHHHPLSLKEWTSLFRKTFKFTGGEITKEFLMSTGYLAGAHHEECKVYQEVLKSEPAWYVK